MTFSLTALITLLMGLFFLALSGPGWGMCLSSREFGNRARLTPLRAANVPPWPAAGISPCAPERHLALASGR